MTNDEMYRKMCVLRTEDEILGCYIEGHHDMEQFKRVAVDFLKTECDMEVPEEYRVARKGYYKIIPRFKGWSILYFSEKPMRGAKPIMEMQYL
ncbi:hypothetical protein BR63_05695 [Thermanaerosceptrum fracticalcis]|uniref:Uncharacterized protein n=1 Tax=Thermanaerosceptrum fracticalcis TaxID=1712410 RepID=A0A7G6E198_THEFR|nr:hypothetical protein [Thermanaerosceptrum fracticalcis]QNB45852.1 hypothetical protein BR63_05695 [Thermanaerosceptrum fracticalcis]